MAGEQLYAPNRYGLCHGVNGESLEPDLILDTTRDYNQILSLVRDEGSGMPPWLPTGDCAAQIADYIWGRFLGVTLYDSDDGR